MRRVLGLVVVVLVAMPSSAAAQVAVVGADPPTGHGVFRFPQAIAYSPGGSQIFVGDQYSAVVQQFERDGRCIRDIGFPGR